MIRALVVLIGLILVGLIAGAWVTRAGPLDASDFADLTGDSAHGETVYYAAGCGSCHTAPASDETLLLAGGQHFETEFGTFYAPNVSPDPVFGIGSWSTAQFASAVKRGTSPNGRHYYPVFPYTSYARMTDQDVVDLWAFWQTLPVVDTPSRAHDVQFPFSQRAGLGVWKALFLDPAWVAPADTPQSERGRYLVEALAHCGECHTPRNSFGGLVTSEWMAGADNPSGSGRIPSLLAPEFDWSVADIAYYLETGFTPDFDSAGGQMVAVIENMARLSTEDRLAIAAYVAALRD